MSLTPEPNTAHGKQMLQKRIPKIPFKQSERVKVLLHFSGPLLATHLLETVKQKQSLNRSEWELSNGSKLEGHEHWEAKTLDASTWPCAIYNGKKSSPSLFQGNKIILCFLQFASAFLSELSWMKSLGFMSVPPETFLRGISIPSINQHIAPSKQVSKMTLRRLVAATSYTLSKFRQYPPQLDTWVTSQRFLNL